MSDEPTSTESILDRLEPTASDMVPVVKAFFVGEKSGDQSNALRDQDVQNGIFSKAGAIPPIYDPNILALIFENSSALRPNVDAYVTNIDSFGHTFEAAIDLQSEGAIEKVRDAMRAERAFQRLTADATASALPTEPTDEEVNARLDQLELEMRAERVALETFFENCTIDMPFSGPEGLRGLTRQDIEVLGSGYWEVLRNSFGKVSVFNRLEARSIRLMPIDAEATEVKVQKKVSLLTSVDVDARKRFRRYVQIWESRDAVGNFTVSENKVDNEHITYFKEFGDPRLLDAKTGRYFKNKEEADKWSSENSRPFVPATEIIHFKISSTRSSYGVPRWIGTLLSVLGTRQSEEVNFLYFENRSVPPLAITVTGGRMNENSVARIEDYIANQIRGKRNFHKILILEAEPHGAGDPNSGRMKITLQPLTDAQQKDGLFQQYDERNADKVGQSFRLPRILRGDVRDFNRSCYSEDTETLTETGWKLHDEIGPDEKIAAYNPEKGEIVFVVPEKKLVYDVVDESMVRFKNRHTDCLVTEDHRMLVRPDRNEGRWETHLAGSVPYRIFSMPLAADTWTGEEGPEWFELPKSCSIERGHKHQNANRVRMDDWLEFLGYFISEGGLLLTDHPSAPYLVYVDQKKPGTREKIRACLDRIGWTYSTQIKPCGTTHFLLSNKCLRKWLLENVGTNSYDWKIPQQYVGLSARRLNILLSALMAGDGTVDGREGRTSGAYYSMSEELIGQVQSLFIRLGKRAESLPGQYPSAHRVCWSDHKVTQLRSYDQERTPNCVTRALYTGKVYCFSVPGYGFFVTRRNGKTAIQGNTAEAALDFAEVQVFGPQRQQFDWTMNQMILPTLGARYHSFRTNAPTVRDPQAMAEMIKDLAAAGVLTPEESRDLAGAVFNKQFERLSADWTKQPIALTLAGAARQPSDGGSGGGGGLDEFNRNGGMSTGNAGATQEALGVDQTKKNVARALQKIHATLVKAERAEFPKLETETIKIPADLFYSVFVPNGVEVEKTKG